MVGVEIALFASLLWAFNPLALRTGGWLLSESLFSLFFALALWGVSREEEGTRFRDHRRDQGRGSVPHANSRRRTRRRTARVLARTLTLEACVDPGSYRRRDDRGVAAQAIQHARSQQSAPILGGYRHDHCEGRAAPQRETEAGAAGIMVRCSYATRGACRAWRPS